MTTTQFAIIASYPCVQCLLKRRQVAHHLNFLLQIRCREQQLAESSAGVQRAALLASAVSRSCPEPPRCPLLCRRSRQLNYGASRDFREFPPGLMQSAYTSPVGSTRGSMDAHKTDGTKQTDDFQFFFFRHPVRLQPTGSTRGASSLDSRFRVAFAGMTKNRRRYHLSELRHQLRGRSE
jgi:hypothetical protein